MQTPYKARDVPGQMYPQLQSTCTCKHPSPKPTYMAAPRSDPTNAAVVSSELEYFLIGDCNVLVRVTASRSEKCSDFWCSWTPFGDRRCVFYSCNSIGLGQCGHNRAACSTRLSRSTSTLTVPTAASKRHGSTFFIVNNVLRWRIATLSNFAFALRRN